MLTVINNGLWGTAEVQEKTTGPGLMEQIRADGGQSPILEANIRQAVEELFNDSIPPQDRQFRMRTGPEGMGQFHEAVRAELDNIPQESVEVTIERFRSTGNIAVMNTEGLSQAELIRQLDIISNTEENV
jgi:hypothetical protein